MTLFLFAILTTYVVGTLVRRGADDLDAFRRRRRQRAAEAGRTFAVVARPALPHEHEGPGVYVVTGVLERTGGPSRLRVEATGSADAVRQALARGVSPAGVAKQGDDDRACAAAGEVRGT